MAGKAPEFDADVESFGAYTRRLKQHFISQDIGDKQVDKKRAILLCAIGAKTFALLEDLLAPSTVEDKSFDELVEVLKAHYEPEKSEIVARFRFHSCFRNEGETVGGFLARLRNLAKDCQFQPGVLGEMLRDRLVCGIGNERLQSRLLSEPHLTLQSAETLAQAHESAAASAAELSCAGAVRPEDAAGAVHRVCRDRSLSRGGGRAPPAAVGSSRGGDMAARGGDRDAARLLRARGRGGTAGGTAAGQCFRCLGRHLSELCPFRNKVCFSCGLRGHVRAACRRDQQHLRHVSAEEDAVPPPEPGSSGSEDGEPGQSGAGAADSDGVYAMFTVRPGSGDRRPPLMVPVSLDGRSVEMELDTGAALTVCSDAGYRQLWPSDGPELTPCTVTLRTYSGEQLSVLGQANVNVGYNGGTTRLPLIVVKGDGPWLFGRNWLEHIRLDWPAICRVAEPTRMQPILDEFPDVFKEELGCYRGGEVCIDVDPDVRPRFFKPRTVPLAFREQVDVELDKQIRDGLWEQVRHSRWAAPLVVVPKAGGKSLRICGDYRLTVNKAAKVEQYPLPRVEELFAKLAGCSVFSKIDLKNAYNQLLLDEKSREYLTVNTPKGLLRPLRLSFGYASAVSLFQRTLETVLAGVPGVGVFLDDIVVAGADEAAHSHALRQVLQRLTDAGFRVNRAKCSFGVSSMTYLGLKISSRGVEATGEKTAAILKAPEPRDVRELRMWLGLINYYGKFLRNLASILSPLYRLLRAEQPWKWTEVESRAFFKAKELLVSPPVLAHFDPTRPVILACDAGPVGIGCVLSQLTPEGERPVAFYSRTLSDTETRYSQTDKEALAVVTGVKKFHYYVAGRSFTIQSDHKPLLGLIGEQKPLPVMASPRMVRWALMLGAYDYRLEYRPGSKQVHCDALSRLPSAEAACAKVPIPAETIHLLEFFDSSPVSSAQIRRWTSQDPVLSAVYRYVRDGWPDAQHSLCPDFQPYKSRIGELSVQDGCILWGSRVVVPPQGRAAVLKLLHEGHAGECRTKMLARMYLWWPNLDADIRDVVRSCDKCQELQARAPEAPLHPWQWPTRPWQRVHMDYCTANGWMFLVLVDAHSKWMDVYPTKSSDSAITIEKMRMSFANWGVPLVIVTDNAQCFISEAFKAFCKINGIKHLTTPCLSPKSNGLAERGVQTFKKGWYKQSSGTVETKVSRFLFKYRTTPHSTTQCTPAELFLGRVPRTHLDAIFPDRQQRVQERQESQKTYRDRNALERNLVAGDPVYVSAVDRLQGLSRCRWVRGHVVCADGVRFTVKLGDGRVIVRHADQVRRRYSSDNNPQAVINEPLTSSTAVIPSPEPIAEPAPAPASPAEPAPAPAPQLPPAAAVPAPGVAAVPQPEASPSVPRYNLRNRAHLRPPDRYVGQ